MSLAPRLPGAYSLARQAIAAALVCLGAQCRRWLLGLRVLVGTTLRLFGRLLGAAGILLLRGVAAIRATLQWILVPKGETAFDALKHYVAVILGLVGFTALLWAGKQIYNPPIVVIVADLPKPISEEYWLNTQIAR